MIKHSTFTPTKGWLLALLYTMLIGFGMYWCFHIDGYVYGFPEMVKTLWWVEILLTILALGAVFTFANWKKVGFHLLNKSYLWWLAIPAILILASWIELLPALKIMTKAQWSLFALLTFTHALVGFSEELVYRGFVLRSFLTKYPVWLSMLLSAVLFSLLHSVNVLAGLSAEGMIVQLVVTFILGLFYAPLAIKLNNLLPLMLLHWQWNVVVFTSELVATDLSYIGIFLIFQIVAVIPLWFLVLKRNNVNQ